MAIALNATAAYRLETALQLAELAELMVASRIRRERPAASAAEVRAAVSAWYADRPGAPHGDAEGEPAAWPRRG
jgi:hypothetical protein